MSILLTKLAGIQGTLKAPKSKWNSYGKFHYRSLEDILEALKPLIAGAGLSLTISDEIKHAGDYTYVESRARLSHGEDVFVVVAQAGIEPKKGMDLAQCFGCSSTYARKYALNGLFLIDDSMDPDADTASAHNEKPKEAPVADEKKIPLTKNHSKFTEMQHWVQKEGGTVEQLRGKYKISNEMEEALNNV